MPIHSRNLLMLAAATLLLTGCLRVEMSIALSPDDTADGSFLIAVEKGAGEGFGVSDDALVDELTSSSDTDFATGTVEPYEDEKYVGQRITFAGEPLASFGGGETDELSIERDGDDYVVSGTWADADGEDVSAIPGASMLLSITFPGEVTEHNGTLDGTTVTWDLVDAPDEISARGSAEPPRTVPLWAWAAGGAVAAVGAISLVVVLLRRRRSGDAADAVPAVEPMAAMPTFTPASFQPAPLPPAAVLPGGMDTIDTGRVEGTDPEEDHPR